MNTAAHCQCDPESRLCARNDVMIAIDAAASELYEERGTSTTFPGNPVSAERQYFGIPQKWLPTMRN